MTSSSDRRAAGNGSDWPSPETDAAQAADPGISIHFDTTIAALHGRDVLTEVETVDRTGAADRMKACAVFIMAGAAPNCEWLSDLVALDEAGFILTGTAAGRSASFETSVPSIFAGSVKRVASAVGEGSSCYPKPGATWPAPRRRSRLAAPGRGRGEATVSLLREAGHARRAGQDIPNLKARRFRANLHQSCSGPRPPAARPAGPAWRTQGSREMGCSMPRDEDGPDLGPELRKALSELLEQTRKEPVSVRLTQLAEELARLLENKRH